MLKILYYDTERIPVDCIGELYRDLMVKFNGEVIALPKDLELLMDSSVEELTQLRNCIDKLIEQKLNQKEE